MNIIQIVSAVSPDNRYGGPTTVALNQVGALRARGHRVRWLAGALGYDARPGDYLGEKIDAFPAVSLLPGAGFAGLAAPGMVPKLAGLLRGADVVHIHLARDLLTLPAAELVRRSGVRYVVQPHGMIDASEKRLAAVLDAALTRRVLRDAAAVFHLTPREREDLIGVAGAGLSLRELPNGIDADDPPARAPGDPVEVVFMARLHERKRPGRFIAAARELAPEFPEVGFRLLGADEGEGPAVRAAIAAAGLGDRLRWDGPATPAQARAALARAAVYVLPSVDEPYPMTVLEAMRAAAPVIVTDSCGLAPAIADGAAGTVVGPDQESLTAAIRRYLAEPELRREHGRNAAALVAERYAMGPVVDRLLAAYRGSS